MNAWNVFATLYNTFDQAFLATVQGMIAQLVAYVQAPLLAGIVLYVAGMLLVEMFDTSAGGDSGMKIVKLLLRGAIVYFAVSTVGVYNQYFGTLFTQTLPNELSNVIAGATGGPGLGPEAFDKLGNEAWTVGLVTFKNLPAWSLKGVFLALVVCAYWLLVGLAIGLAFLIYLGSSVLVGLLAGLGPLFVCLWLWHRTAKMADAWLGSMAAGVFLQLFCVALLTVLTATVERMVQAIVAAGGGAGNGATNVITQIQILTEAAFLFVVAAVLTKEVARLAAHIGGGVAHSVEPYTKLVAAAAAPVTQAAGAAAGATASRVTSAARNVAGVIRPAGRSLG